MNRRVLNVLIAGHSQHGKSSLINAIVGKFPDKLDFELNHGTTVSLKVIQFYLKKENLLLNFLDSPGHIDFQGSIALGLEFTDVLVLIAAANEGFKARTYWLFDIATKMQLPMIIVGTKMDLPNVSIEKIKQNLEQLTTDQYFIVETSSKKKIGIENLIKRIQLYSKRRENYKSDLKFIILGYDYKKGLGDLISIGILSGTIKTNSFITEKLRVKHMYSLDTQSLEDATEGDIIQISLNLNKKFDLGTKYIRGNFISSKINGLMSEIQPRKEYFIHINDPFKFKMGIEILEDLKTIIPSFNFYIDKKDINIQVLGDVQFDFIKENLEKLIDFKIIGTKIKGIITINKKSTGKSNGAQVKIAPRFKRILTITRNGTNEKKIYDILGSSAAYEAFHLDGLHVDVLSGNNEDNIAQAIAKAIEKVKLIKIIPHQDVIVKIENIHEIYPIIQKYDVEVLYQSNTNIFFLQIKNEQFEFFFNSLMKTSNGKAEISIFNFQQTGRVLSVDPGTRHFGFCLIEKSELPSLWYVNLKSKIENAKARLGAISIIKKELDLFLGNEKELINRIFIGNGPGSNFIIDLLIDYFNIPNQTKEGHLFSKDKMDRKISKYNNSSKKHFKPPEIFLVDEYKTTKEAIFHLQQGKLVSEVKSKGFVDHAIAALLIAKRGIKGEVVEIENEPLKQLYDYVIEQYAGTYSFSSIHNINNLYDIKPGMYLRVKDNDKLDSNLKNGDIVVFTGFGESFNNIHANTLSGNKIIIKFQLNTKLKREFFDIFTPMRQKN
ncbi:MAG: GTP-binding protein [Candidatus Lokiarchaeota archaeon]|nr:GTP-binding protein [Candidatus Lokiarchaeota archaeon]